MTPTPHLSTLAMASEHTSESEATAILAMPFLCSECGRSLGEVIMGDPRMCDWAGAPYCDVCWIRWEIDQMVQSLRCISHGSSLGALISDSVIADGTAMYLASERWEWGDFSGAESEPGGGLRRPG